MAESTDLQRLIVSLEANIRKYEKELARANGVATDSTRRVERNFDKMNANVGAGFTKLAALAAGAFSVVALVAFSKKMVEAADNIADSAARIGITTDSFQELAYAFKLAGVDSDGLEKAMLQLTKRIGGSQDEVDEVTRALNKLGIGIADLKGKKADEAFRIIVDRIAGVKDSTRQAAIGVDLFGREFQKLLPTIRGGSAELARLAAEARKMGLVLSADTLKKAGEAADEFDRVGLALRAAGINISVGMLPALTELRKLMTDEGFQSGAKRLGEAIGEMVRWMVNNQTTILTVTGALAGLRFGGLPGAAVGGLGGYIIGAERAKEKTTALMAEIDKLVEKQRQLAELMAGRSLGEKEHTDLLNQYKAISAEIEKLKAGTSSAGAAMRSEIAKITAELDRLAASDERIKKTAEMAERVGAVDTVLQQGKLLLQNESQRIALLKERSRLLDEVKKKEQEAAVAAPPRVDVGVPTGFKDDALLKWIQDTGIQARIARGEFSQFADGFVEMAMKLPLTREQLLLFNFDLAKMPDLIQRANEKMKELTASKDLQKAAEDFGKAFGTAFENAILKAKDFKDVLKALQDELARIMLRLLVTNQLERALRTGFNTLLGSIGLPVPGVGPSGASTPPIVGPQSAAGPMAMPNAAMPSMKSPASMTTLNISIDARGADQAAVVRIERGLHDLSRTLPQRVGAIARDRQVRHIR